MEFNSGVGDLDEIFSALSACVKGKAEGMDSRTVLLEETVAGLARRLEQMEEKIVDLEREIEALRGAVPEKERLEFDFTEDMSVLRMSGEDYEVEIGGPAPDSLEENGPEVMDGASEDGAESESESESESDSESSAVQSPVVAEDPEKEEEEHAVPENTVPAPASGSETEGMSSENIPDEETRNGPEPAPESAFRLVSEVIEVHRPEVRTGSDALPHTVEEAGDRTDVAEEEESRFEQRSLFESGSQEPLWKTDMPGPYITHITHGITINDKIRFINVLFGEDADVYRETIDHLDSLSTFPEAESYLREKFPAWDDHDDDVYGFYMTIRRKLRK